MRVIGLEQAVAGPMCTRHLSDLGADVIKVERIGQGDFSRHYNVDVLGYSSYAVWLNRGKRSIAVDLKTTDGQTILRDLCRSADVLVSNFAPGASARLVTDDALARTCRRLTRCYITGYGPTGRYSSRKAYDLLIQGEAGVTWSTGTKSQKAKVGVSLVDLAGGIYAASLILAELVGRSSTKEGRRLDISLFDIMLDWMAPLLLAERYGGGAPEPRGLRHAAIVPYGAFTTSDGELVNIAVQNEREWKLFCGSVLERDDLAANPRYATNSQRVGARQAVEREVQRSVGNLSSREFVLRLERTGLAWGRINTPAEVLRHEQLATPGSWTKVRIPSGAIVDLVSAPLGVADTHTSEDLASVPRVGQHTSEILSELGYSAARSAALSKARIVWTEPVSPGEDTRVPKMRKTDGSPGTNRDRGQRHRATRLGRGVS